MNPAPIDPWAFELPDYLLRASVSPGETRAYDAAVRPDVFYQDDRQITAAALELHPLLGDETVAALLGALSPADPDVHYEPGTLLPELDESKNPAIHLMIAGRARLVVTFLANGEARRHVVGQYRPGQWVGLPNLLREDDCRVGWPVGCVRLHAEALSAVRTQRIAFDDGLALVKSHPDFRRFLEHHVAIRFARRREMLRRLAENPLLCLLNPADREYLLQLGALVSPGSAAGPYLAAGTPSGRAALLLRGEATLRVPEGATGRSEYVATLRPGDLFGHEGLVMDAELQDPSAADVEIVEPPRRTEVRIASDTQVLQLYWYALRWVLDDRAAVWSRVKRMLSNDPAGIAVPMPALVSFQAAHPGLGATALAYGTGAELARSGGRTVTVIDLQGQKNFAARWAACGFGIATELVRVQEGPRKRRAEGRRTELACHALEPVGDTGWPPGLKVLWPDPSDADAVEDLVDAMEADEDVSHVVLAGSDCGDHGLATQVLDRLQGRCSAVFHLCDDADAVYPGPEPEHLTWVYRMTPAYRAREEERAKRVRLAWLLGGAIKGTSDLVRRAIEAVLGYDPGNELQRESLHGPRRVVRVPDDPAGARTFDRGGVGELVGPDAPRSPLARAFARLARVVNGHTVGLALGGGGAWGFSHVALLRNLEDQGVPIDYIAGTSFGAVVGGLYAVGGMRALDQLVEANSASGPGIGPMLRALATGSLNRALFVAPFSSLAVETFVHGELRSAGVVSSDAPCLGTTEVPFYPVGTNLGTHELLALPHATVGWGVRMSGSLPPIFPTLLRGSDRVADGAFIANVPSRVVRDVGAHFVIAANVVPPPPASMPVRLDVRSLVTWVPRKIVERLEDTVRGVFVLGWKAGEDQGALAADYTLDLRPEVANLFEMWRGRDIVDEVAERHFEGDKKARIREAWDRFCGNRAPSSDRQAARAAASPAPG
jgi:predicted acylesterase/phospholipase RssA/CRP-like cAMP-binding protein